MNPKLRRFPRPSRRLVSGICLMFLVVGVAADGPLNIVAGVTQTSDNNDSEGETWGRPGGRTIVYSVGNTTAFDTLWFGATSLPTAAFDNGVNAPGETMTFDPTSNLAGGVARWTGQAFLPLAVCCFQQTINTRFTMTITNAANTGVPMTNYAGGPTPGIDVQTVGSSFSVNLLFEAFAPAGYVGAGNWVPILNFYDAAPTPEGNPPDEGGPALTGFERGFYFTNAGLTLEEHDANITAQTTALSGQIGSVKNDTAFLRADMPGQFAGLGNAVGEVRNSLINTVQPGVSQIQTTANMTQTRVNEIYNLVQSGIPPDIARRSDVESAKTSINDFLMILIGLKPCPLSPAQCAGLTFMPQVARQTSVDQLSQQLSNLAAAVEGIQASLQAPSSLELQVVELTEADSAHRRRWLLRTSVNGAPVPVELTGVIAITTDKKKPSTPTDVTAMAVVTQLMPGLIEVSLDVSKPNLADLAFHFSVRHIDGAELMEASSVVGDTKK